MTKILNDFLRRKFSSMAQLGVSGLFYPELLLTQINIAEYDSSSESLSEDEIHNLLSLQGTEIHEHVHWGQFSATTWGLWCLMINQSKSNLFVSPANQRFSRDFFSLADEVIIKKNFNLDNKCLDYLPKEVSLFYQDWLAHTLTYNFFLDGGFDYEQNIGQLSHYIATALSFTYFGLNNGLDLGEEGRIIDFEKKLLFDDFSFLKTKDNSFITVKSLFEGQARINELIYSIETGVFSIVNDNEKFLNYIQGVTNYNIEYWSAYEIYSQYFDLSPMNLVTQRDQIIEELTKLSIIIDISLNPALPPFVPKDIMNNLKWKEIYPPFIFIEICEVLSKENFRINPYRIDSILRFYDFVSEKISIPSPIEQARYYLREHSQRIQTLSGFWYQDEISDFKGIGMFEYFYQLITETSLNRVEFPILYASRGLCYSENYINDYRVYTNKNYSRTIWTDSSPLQVNMKIESGDLATPFNKERKVIFKFLVLHIVYNNVLNHILFGSKEIEVNFFPFEVPRWLRNMVQSEIKNRFNVDIQWV